MDESVQCLKKILPRIDEESLDKLTIPCKKEAIIKYASGLVYDDRMIVLSIIKQSVEEKLIKKHSDGSRINLDALNDNMIHKVYHIVNTMVNASTKLALEKI